MRVVEFTAAKFMTSIWWEGMCGEGQDRCVREGIASSRRRGLACTVRRVPSQPPVRVVRQKPAAGMLPHEGALAAGGVRAEPWWHDEHGKSSVAGGEVDDAASRN